LFVEFEKKNAQVCVALLYLVINVWFILFTQATLEGKEHDSIEFYKWKHANFPINNSYYALHVFRWI